MTIHREQFQPYEGPVSSPRRRFWVITRQELRLAWQRRWIRRLLLLSFLPLVVCLVILYVELVIKKTLNMDLWGGEVFDVLYRAQSFFVVLLMAIGGADLVAKDVAANAHALYFSRPLDLFGYLAGKVLAIAIMLGLITLIPGVVLDVGQLLLAYQTDIPAFLAKLVQVAAYSILLSLVAGTVITCLSSFGWRSRYVGIAWIALYFVSNGLSVALTEAVSPGARFSAFSLISIQALFRDSGRLFYAADKPPIWPLVCLVCLGALAGFILYRRIVALERREA
ncbi:MAG: hypothetical protein JW797_18725 [Bradymonadales bacterium]|nr:hypothetical protein [Bradymonadales bacterium]